MGMACLLGCCLMLGSCSSEVDNLDIPKGKGFVKIDLAPEVGFQTKAVDESEYKDVNNYTVQVFKSGQEENLIINDLYKNLEEKYSLNVGNYVLKAFTGEDKPVSSDVLYFSGEAAFEVKEGKEVTAPVICKPSSATSVAISCFTCSEIAFPSISVIFNISGLERSAGVME